MAFLIFVASDSCFLVSAGAFSLRVWLLRAASSFGDMPCGLSGFLPISLWSVKSSICWDMPSVRHKNMALKPSLLLMSVWENTLPMPSVRLPLLGRSVSSIIMQRGCLPFASSPCVNLSRRRTSEYRIRRQSMSPLFMKR